MGWPWPVPLLTTTANQILAGTQSTAPTLADLQFFLEGAGIRHFGAHEFAGRDVPPRDLWDSIIPTARFADALRDRFGPTYCCNEDLQLDGRGYRSLTHNAEEGGAPDSMHIRFNALDLTCERGEPRDWSNFLRGTYAFDKLGGIGLYRTFIHIDTRWLVFGRSPWYKEYP